MRLEDRKPLSPPQILGETTVVVEEWAEDTRRRLRGKTMLRARDPQRSDKIFTIASRAIGKGVFIGGAPAK
jgi:hypothetical protein